MRPAACPLGGQRQPGVRSIAVPVIGASACALACGLGGVPCQIAPREQRRVALRGEIARAGALGAGGRDAAARRSDRETRARRQAGDAQRIEQVARGRAREADPPQRPRAMLTAAPLALAAFGAAQRSKQNSADRRRRGLRSVRTPAAATGSDHSAPLLGAVDARCRSSRLADARQRSDARA